LEDSSSYQTFNNAFMNALSPTSDQAIDERMAKFRGNNSMKQYVRDKPILRGFKHWCRNDSATGYLFQFDIYVGRKENTEHGLSEGVVLNLSRSLENMNKRIFIDNFYTSPTLLFKLKAISIFATYTVRNNRNGLPKNIIPYKSMKGG
ncbi:Uncharacterized protein FKW44_013823, partial [Caligus rogercresseyi]